MTDKNTFINKLAEGLDIDLKTNVNNMNPLSLAFIGDTVFDLAIRTLLIENFDVKAHNLHRMSSARARASAQAKAARVIFNDLNDQESNIFIRARNAKPGTVPKSASLEDYSLASALEAVIGYLYLKGNDERLLYLIKKSMEAQDDDSTKIIGVFRP